MKKIILITGVVTSGKTTLLSSLAGLLSSQWQVDGFVAKAPERIHCSVHFASRYVLHRIGTEETYPWATQKENNNGYSFDVETQYFLDHRFARQVVKDCPDILFLDELGSLELRGAGLEKVLQSAIDADINILVCTVKKRFFNEIINKYSLQEFMCIDLDTKDRQHATDTIIRYINFF